MVQGRKKKRGLVLVPFFLFPRGKFRMMKIQIDIAALSKSVTNFTFFLLSIIILIAITGCAKSVNSKPVRVLQNENSTEGEQSLLKIVIYTDFECGACERLNLKIEPKLREFKAAGVAQIDIRVLGAISDDSARAAQAALWAAEEGRFLEYHDALFQEFRQNNENPCSKKKLIDLAGSLGLKKKALQRCLDSECKKTELIKNMDLAKTDGVHVLPAVLINGTKIEGFKPLETYIDVINQTLAKQSN
jgi:protein-disulfide isomerase